MPVGRPLPPAGPCSAHKKTGRAPLGAPGRRPDQWGGGSSPHTPCDSSKLLRAAAAAPAGATGGSTGGAAAARGLSRRLAAGAARAIGADTRCPLAATAALAGLAPARTVGHHGGGRGKGQSGPEQKAIHGKIPWKSENWKKSVPPHHAGAHLTETLRFLGTPRTFASRLPKRAAVSESDRGRFTPSTLQRAPAPGGRGLMSPPATVCPAPEAPVPDQSWPGRSRRLATPRDHVLASRFA